jgi:hypothetical protein
MNMVHEIEGVGEEETSLSRRQLTHIKVKGCIISLKGNNDNVRGTKWKMTNLSDFYNNNNNHVHNHGESDVTGNSRNVVNAAPLV